MNRLIVGTLATAVLALSACTGGSPSPDTNSAHQQSCGPACDSPGASSAASSAATAPKSTTAGPSDPGNAGATRDGSADATPRTSPASHGPIMHRGSTLVYRVTSDATKLASISYVGNKGQVDVTDVRSGNWAKRVSASTVQYSVLIAVRDGSGSYIACSITQNGKVLVTNKSSGSAKGVNCQI